MFLNVLSKQKEETQLIQTFKNFIMPKKIRYTLFVMKILNNSAWYKRKRKRKKEVTIEKAR